MHSATTIYTVYIVPGEYPDLGALITGENATLVRVDKLHPDTQFWANTTNVDVDNLYPDVGNQLEESK